MAKSANSTLKVDSSSRGGEQQKPTQWAKSFKPNGTHQEAASGLSAGDLNGLGRAEKTLELKTDESRAQGGSESHPRGVQGATAELRRNR